MHTDSHFHRRAKKRKQYNRRKLREEQKLPINSNVPASDANTVKKKPISNEILVTPTSKLQIGKTSWINSRNHLGSRLHTNYLYHKNKRGVHDRAIQKEIRDSIFNRRNPFVDFMDFGHILPDIQPTSSSKDAGHWRKERSVKRLTHLPQDFKVQRINPYWKFIHKRERFFIYDTIYVQEILVKKS